MASGAPLFREGKLAAVRVAAWLEGPQITDQAGHLVIVHLGRCSRGGEHVVPHHGLHLGQRDLVGTLVQRALVLMAAIALQALELSAARIASDKLELGLLGANPDQVIQIDEKIVHLPGCEPRIMHTLFLVRGVHGRLAIPQVPRQPDGIAQGTPGYNGGGILVNAIGDAVATRASPRR